MAGGGARQLSSTESTHKLCLGDLHDNLLLEILLRLPTAKHALICSSVCKKWYGFILNRFFIDRFVSYHMDRDVNYNCNLAIDGTGSSHEALMLCQNPKFQIKRLDLSSLCEGITWAGIVSSCHDLVLCVVNKKDKKGFLFSYFICNFLTMESIALPVLADWLKDYPYLSVIQCAFICKPCTPLSDDGCRYRVLRFGFDKKSNVFGLEMYCSETPDRLYTVNLLHEGAHGEVLSNLFAFKEKVHWFNGTNIVAYDPFSRCYGDTSEVFCDTSECFCILHPDTEQWHPDTDQRMSAIPFHGLGICQGRLRFMELGNLNGEELTAYSEAACLRVWDLKDYENKEWSMERRFSLYTLAAQSELAYEDPADWDVFIMRILAPHPFDEDVFYLSFNDIIASCNMRTEELEVVDEDIRDRWSSRDKHVTSAKLITIPWWPTAILQHSQQ